MTNPAKVEGLDATVYDVPCKADHLPEPSRRRMIFIRFDQERAAVLDATGVTDLKQLGGRVRTRPPSYRRLARINTSARVHTSRRQAKTVREE
jgi:hypothetical protein